MEEPSADQVVVPVGSSRALRKAGYRWMGEPPQSPTPVPFPCSETRRWAALFRGELRKCKTRGSCGIPGDPAPSCPAQPYLGAGAGGSAEALAVGLTPISGGCFAGLESAVMNRQPVSQGAALYL